MPDEYRLGRLKGRWVVSWWRDGRRTRYRLKAAGRADAEREAIDVIRAAAVATAKREPLTVAELWEAYRKEKDGRCVAETMRFEWKSVGPHFGHLRADQIDVKTCRAYIAKRRAAKRHDGTIWTELGHLRTVLRWAHAERMIDHVPTIERPAKPAPKDRYLTRTEIDALLAAPMAHHIRLAILLMLSTAARVGAILELRWDRVDFERGQIDFRASDIGPRKGRAIVPINESLRAALQTAKGAALSDYVVEWSGGPVKSIKTGFNAAVRDSGLKGVSPHVLRHTAAVHLAAAGVPMSKISQYLGHTSTGVTERVYARFAPDHLREAADVLNFTRIK